MSRYTQTKLQDNSLGWRKLRARSVYPIKLVLEDDKRANLDSEQRNIRHKRSPKCLRRVVRRLSLFRINRHDYTVLGRGYEATRAVPLGGVMHKDPRCPRPMMKAFANL